MAQLGGDPFGLLDGEQMRRGREYDEARALATRLLEQIGSEVP